ncbi:hypothetical protein Tco_0277770 [Tanacetum coccineum]
MERCPRVFHALASENYAVGPLVPLWVALFIVSLEVCEREYGFPSSFRDMALSEYNSQSHSGVGGRVLILGPAVYEGVGRECVMTSISLHEVSA